MGKGLAKTPCRSFRNARNSHAPAHPTGAAVSKTCRTGILKSPLPPPQLQHEIEKL